jgi:hypothetical protein
MYFTPVTGSTGFTGRAGTVYVTTGGPVDFPPSDINLACSNGWVQASNLTYPGLADNPQLGVQNPLGTVGPVKIFQSNVPMILAPTGTMANNGAITLGTALPTGFMGGECYLYLPANAISAGSAAGWYYTVMSSTTVGQVFNLTYTSGIPYVPASPIAFATTGPGAYTGVTTIQNALSFTLPAGLMGFNGVLEISALIGFRGSVNAKTVGITLGGSSVFVQVNTTAANVSYEAYVQVGNQGQVAGQVVQASGAVGALTVAQTYIAVNTAVAQTILVQVTDANATDWICIDSISATVTPG